ncbi:class I adenylate-forming enzyme family protein [Nitrosomonas sp. Nm166]|uniref:class I adenylate-forming enzyme family protein n=1 Tax=Nitrosomonas sp. Nm166 TaxID=1881054 RepID=UPI0008ECB362|nr:class I adenylate-forming enzyme family protein [Nitrosomonas sp. Nm166]SFE34667.1 acyl-CoA synthetase [Nitrosomonas sp. Nm166]
MNHSGILDLVPAEIRNQWIQEGIYPNKSLYELFCEHVQQNPAKPAVISFGQTIIYAELQHKVCCLAASFRALGVVAGDVIAYQLSNSWYHCAIDLAAAALGAIVAPFPPGRGRLDIQSLLSRCDARVIIVEQTSVDMGCCELIESLRTALLSLRILIVDGESRDGWHTMNALLQSEPIQSSQLPTVDPNSPARFLISSGTESDPKWIAYSHNALAGGRGRFLQRIHPDRSTFRGLYLMPLGTAFGSTATFGILSWLGGSVLVLRQFDVSAAIRAIAELKPTHIFGVPTMLQRIVADPALAEIDTSSLIAIVSGGAKIDEASIRRCTEAFGCGFISLYGSADGVNCHTTLEDNLETIVHKIGRPNPEVCSIKIVDDQKQEVTPGCTGEIVARGPITPMQYVNNPDLDALYRDKDGWVYTGDLGLIDSDGYLVLTGRKKDIIIRGGVNISPAQIENIAASHPAVVSAVCIPVADEDLGQRICLCLVMQDGAERPSLSQFTRYLQKQGLEKNKLPEYLRYFRQLPLGPAGKIDKKQLTVELESVQFKHSPDNMNMRSLSGGLINAGTQ